MEKANIKVIKRDGTQVPFDRKRIITAVEKAMRNGSGIYKPELAQSIADDIYTEAINEAITRIAIETIEDKVFNKLIKYKQVATAKSYESYRAVREHQRKNNTIDDDVMGLVNMTNKAVINENSNKNATINSTQRDLIAGEISKDIAMRKLIPTHLVQAHKEGSIHIHDLDYFLQPMTNCSLTNLSDMLQNGTVVNRKGIRTPNSFQVACTLTSQVIAQISSCQYGL